MTDEDRLRRVEDHIAITQLEASYGPAYDVADGAAWAALFTPDGIYSSRDSQSSLGVTFIQGTKNLDAFCRGQGMSGIHMMYLPKIVITGDTAVGRMHFHHRGRSNNHSVATTLSDTVGYYDTAYLRTPDGWRIHRHVTTVFESRAITGFGYLSGVGDLSVPPPLPNGEFPALDPRTP